MMVQQNTLLPHPQTAIAMPDTPTIFKTPQLDNSQDYNFLRTQGLKYIEELGSSLWTDYNEHDPGITILEALCYAITELGYRSAMPMQNLLAGVDGTISSTQTLYTAKNILTQSPLTIDDYRKLLIDIVGIHNAWFFTDDAYTIDDKTVPAGEVAVYADCDSDSLSYNITPHPILISGLYKVLVDLDNDLQYGDLNNGEVTVLNPATTAPPPQRSFKAGEASLTISFPKWNDKHVSKDALTCDVASISINTISSLINDGNGGWTITVSISTNVNPITIDGDITVDLQPASGALALGDVQSFFTTAFTQQVISLYVMKIQLAKKIVQTVIRVLNENRNLCEDFVTVDSVIDEEVAICCDIDVIPSADMEEVQAQAFYAIEEYLNPTIKFYTLDELQAKGKTTDEIFEGPKLDHGFIDTDELEATQLRDEIYASDIISLLMDITGVTAVRNFRMTKYDSNGKPVSGQTGKSWCMPITLWHKPVFSETKSKIVFYKNQFPYLPSLSEVRDTLKWLRAIGMRNKLNGHALDIPLPTGNYISLDEYTSIEYLFPQTYGIGKAGLPTGATDERTAQSRQLKAYLMFYDQLLADFFSQLKNAGNLFSTATIKQTYYAQFIDSIKNIDPIYKKSGANNLLQQLLQQQDATISPANGWQTLYESNETYLDRHNRFLDHLMARFAESFNEYVLLMYSLDYQTQQETSIDPAHIIQSKIDFLKTYPDISYQRARAYNYYPQDDTNPNDFSVKTSELWDTDNVSGLEKKASFLGGIENYMRRFLYCIGQAIFITTNDTPAKYQFVFKNSNGDALTSVTSYATQAEATAALPQFLTYVLDNINYEIKKSASGKWHINITDENNIILASSGDFISKTDAKNAVQLFINEFEKECNSTGLYLIEHLLLRPRDQSFLPAPVCLDKNCDFCGEQDPYSFRMSVVLPYWPEHFRSLAFRNYFEDIIRREAPAHTMVRVCWINNEAMYEFDNAYKDWITALANYAFDASDINKSALQVANDKMIQILFNLHSEYPVAALHDCEESKDTNPVMLGKTILGSFKN
jgi:uncharacterized protein YegP (UPF0339 family)